MSTASENRMTSAPSPDGRRIIVAVVTGKLGQRIQDWRLRHDPEQAERLPPHTTLCYWAPSVDPAVVERQLRHAFCEPVAVKLGRVREFDNDQHTFYVDVSQTETLNEARRRLYDGTYLELKGATDWSWHVTCVRDSRDRDIEELRAAAAELVIEDVWRIDRVSYLGLEGGSYRELASWQL